jgi:hypothetical protein
MLFGPLVTFNRPKSYRTAPLTLHFPRQPKSLNTPRNPTDSAFRPIFSICIRTNYYVTKVFPNFCLHVTALAPLHRVNGRREPKLLDVVSTSNKHHGRLSPSERQHSTKISSSQPYQCKTTYKLRAVSAPQDKMLEDSTFLRNL